jgi:hypothetical protein
MQYSSQYSIFYIGKNEPGVYRYPDKLSSVAGANALLAAEFLSNTKNHFGFGLNFNQKGFVEQGEVISENGTVKTSYSDTYRLNYAAFQLNYRRDLFQIKSNKIFLNNGLATEYQLNSPSVNKSFGFSYAGGLGTEIEMKGRWNLLLMSEYRTALHDYNDSYTGHYKPYSLWLSVGFRRK